MASAVLVDRSRPSSLSIADLGLAIHGDKQQTERDWVLNEFKTGKSPIMVATDVASRGIGMVDRRSALPSPFPTSSIDVVWLCFCEALLSADVRASAATFWSRLIMISFGYPCQKLLDIRCSVACYIFHSVSLCTIRVPRRIGFFLTCSSCIPQDYPGP